MSTAVKIEKAVLVEAFRQAEQAALAEIETEDGGTCNFDTPVLRLPGIRLKFLEGCAAQAGIAVSAFRWFGGRRCFFCFVTLSGQGNRRTRMAEAACKKLKEAGLDAIMYYQMD